MAARWPEALPALMAEKVAQLANPKVVRLYQLIGRIAENWEDEELLRETADLMSELLEQAAASGELDRQDEQMPDAAFIGLVRTRGGGGGRRQPPSVDLDAEHLVQLDAAGVEAQAGRRPGRAARPGPGPGRPRATASSQCSSRLAPQSRSVMA